MSAPPLSEAGPTSVGASFYVSQKPSWNTHLLTGENRPDATYTPHETTPETVENMAPPLSNNSIPGLGGSAVLDGNFEIAADPPEPSYIGEDGRLALLRADLRAIDTFFRDTAAKSPGSSAIILDETLRLLPSILRTLTQFVGELQANNSQLHMSNTRLQATQKIGQAKEQQLQGKMTIHRPWVPGLTRSKAHIGLLREELALVKDAKMKLEFRIDELRRDAREVEAQKDSLEAELELPGVGESGVESSSKKRRRQG
ncbi:hypothetical protein DL98DRAFT_540394 [Cadophora sp. DSE1049]|nr:hypothetical protein DL98DRAFT_540394 [Cadophora sp. DSE1049]